MAILMCPEGAIDYPKEAQNPNCTLAKDKFFAIDLENSSAKVKEKDEDRELGRTDQEA